MNIIGELPKYGEINIGYKFKDGTLIAYKGTHVDQTLYKLIKEKGLTEDQFDNMFANHQVEGGWVDYQGNFYTNAKEALEMKRKMTNKIKEHVGMIVRRELLKAINEDAQEEMEKASYQAYNDMYLVPQSNWRVKTSDVNMYDDRGFPRKGKIGEVHKLSTIEYDFMHEGEVVTECNGKTYTINSEDFKNGFEKIVDEEGLKVNNESVNKLNEIDDRMKKMMERYNEKRKLRKPQWFNSLDDVPNKELYIVDKYIKYDKIYNFKGLKLQIIMVDQYLGTAISKNIDTNKYTDFYSAAISQLSKNIKEDIKKLSSIKDYYGKNIKETIERLENHFLTEARHSISYDMAKEFADAQKYDLTDTLKKIKKA